MNVSRPESRGSEISFSGSLIKGDELTVQFCWCVGDELEKIILLINRLIHFSEIRVHVKTWDY